MEKKYIKTFILLISFISLINTKFNLRSNTNDIENNLPDLGWISHRLVYENHLIKNFEHSSFRVIESDDGNFRSNIITITKLNNKVDIIAVFRGTEISLIWNLWADFNVTPTRLKGLCEDCQVHMGFYDAYQYLKEKFIINLTEEIILQTKNGKEINNIYFTGHSLGGSIATIAAYDFLNRRAADDLTDKYFKLMKNISLITFGSPRVGVIEFKDFFEKKDLLRDNIRVVYGEDVVPDLVAGYPLSFYRHCGDFVYFPQNNFDNPLIFERNEVDTWVRPGGILDKLNFPQKIKDHSKYSLLSVKGLEYAINKLREQRK
jgi:hypothetical protein